LTPPRYDVVAIGNAIVDILAQADDGFIAEQGMSKGSMQLIFSAEEADQLYAKMGPGREISGGSAANTVAAIAALGGKTAFIGQVADDQLGQVFAHDVQSVGVDFATAARPGEPSTARCLILVTPDGQRTMNTFLGASQFLPPHAIDEGVIRAGNILYLEGYLWDPEEPRAAMRRAMTVAREAKRMIAFTLSDVFCISRHGDDFRQLIADGLIDILFANEAELHTLAGTEDFEAAVQEYAGKVPVLVVTRSEKGAMIMYQGVRYEIAAHPVETVVDTTGAGDLFAAGVLYGIAQKQPIDRCLAVGAICAAEIISHYGARAEADLKSFVMERLEA
jgi:sugar/nucleoside kinase (ribokinase family)